MKNLMAILMATYSISAFSSTVILQPDETLNFGENTFVCTSQNPDFSIRVFSDELTKKKWLYLGTTISEGRSEACAEVGYRLASEAELTAVYSRLFESQAGIAANNDWPTLWYGPGDLCSRDLQMTSSSGEVSCLRGGVAQTWCVQDSE